MYNNGKTNINIYSGILFFKQPCYAINEIYEEEYMVKNLRAVSNWRKVRSHLSESAIGQIDHKSATIKSKQKTERLVLFMIY